MGLLYLIPVATSLVIFGVDFLMWATMRFASLSVHHQYIRFSMLQQFYFDKSHFKGSFFLFRQNGFFSVIICQGGEMGSGQRSVIVIVLMYSSEFSYF